MKSVNWSLVKKAMYLASIAFMMATTVACSKEKKSNVASRGYRNTSGAYQDPIYNSQTGQSSNSWGSIAHAGMNVLSDFMGGAELGQVSTGFNDGTGIRFRGFVSEGKIEMLVWDDYANQNGQPYYWTLSVRERNTNQNPIRIVAQDGSGTVIFQGHDNGSSFTGQVLYDNGSGTRTLGNFSISSGFLY